MNKKTPKPLTPPKAFFNWCTAQIPTYEWQNKKETILASSRKNCPIIKKRLTKYSRLSFPTKFYSFGIILVRAKRIEIQTHSYWQTITDGIENLIYEPSNLERFSNDTHVKAHYENGHWHEGLLANYGYMSSAYTNTVFYPNNWQENLMTNSELKYLKLPVISRQELAHIYKYRNEIEFLQKIGATTLANEILFNDERNVFGTWHKKVDMRIIKKNWLKANKQRLKTTNPTFHMLMLEKTLKERKVAKIEGIENYLHYSQIKQLPKEVNLTKFQHWFMRKGERFSYYMDYLHMLEELNTPFTDDVLFPKNLQLAHDNATNTLNLLERELEEQQYQERKIQLKALETEIDDLLFLAPHSLQEIVEEGQVLHHCVGIQHYLEQHTNGTTTIIFIRRKEEPSMPYFTLEYRNQQVTQIQGKRNRQEIPEKIKQAVRQWQENLQHALSS
ncbi:PcfJ domain-containing protein (plasmid) [Enterococcus faecalis]|uniref:PcfJ domain-containing protein n=2 Tax=Enterococcus faecalis TaxID=1351 RepID=UPI002240DCAF|nr:PcfJ domain-containing protein [Enterococcus faecalis]MCV6008728.1 PcfJ domain-containing protein [Enterococcus faecalis]MCV6014725.1 PcfJ domain-containing protein [Enterococcus faecalis]MDV7857596.1 PcfJ domain-containing protein [Enterococcus faecalis]UZN30206.1 PcfJ domain-containing protein [Enterococcus faecalis]